MTKENVERNGKGWKRTETRKRGRNIINKCEREKKATKENEKGES